MEEIIATGVGEHTNVFQLLCLSSDFSPVPSEAQIQPSWKLAAPHPVLKGKLCSAIEMDVLVVGFFGGLVFFFFK